MAIIITVSMVLTFLIIYILLRVTESPLTGVITSSMFIAIVSIVVGTLLSSYVSKKMLRPILNINDAAKKVARGDFTVRLEEGSIANEIREIAENFNLMLRELSNTETLRNDFVSNVSHEFKTPLSVIEGYAMLLQDETLTKEEERKYVRTILENTGRLTELTQSILSLSQIENQEIILQKERFQLDEQIRRVLLDFESIWENKNLTIDINMDETYIYGSQSLLARVWSNLIDNAIKFSDQDGLLSIECYEEGTNIVVIVKDTGIGMDEVVMKHAFDKFYQGERSHHVKGNGLGLALVHRIVTLCGGTVSLKSEKGNGTAVMVKLQKS
ncbi:HAMP domain-containing sensor histidine kinase [Paenibacillus senegalimassiliensis]|uniref:HAMP domain-containing sensor histidine kinase n=1 Tax=Paenibacillus senegalimassiliensis TaxID=1737426 RepID=UPI00073E2BB0|nr:HAMP domain-containing sensor histidine kinase [Paenibacillus senegalimassiliensis]